MTTVSCVTYIGFLLITAPDHTGHRPPVQSSKYNAKLMVKDEGQDPRSASELVSLEDKQGRKEETLKKLLAIAGEDWGTQSGIESVQQVGILYVVIVRIV